MQGSLNLNYVFFPFHHFHSNCNVKFVFMFTIYQQVWKDKYNTQQSKGIKFRYFREFWLISQKLVSAKFISIPSIHKIRNFESCKSRFWLALSTPFLISYKKLGQHVIYFSLQIP